VSADLLTSSGSVTSGASLEVRAVHRTFDGESGPVAALAGVSLYVEPASFDAVIGPSGCGKSTLFQILAGLQQPDAGDVLIDGLARRDRLGICAYMPQRDGLLEHLRTVDNVALGLTLQGVGRAAARQRAQELLDRFGLGRFAGAWPWQLSGGMRHRAAFLRTVLLDRAAMLLDEPFGALDGITRGELHTWLLDVWEAVGSTVALITHDVAEAVFLADRVHVMTPRPGRVCATFPIELPRPRTPEMQESAAFAGYEAQLREALREQRA